MVEDPAQTVDVLQLLACESYYEVIDPFYNLVLDTKLVRDEQAATMLDIIFENKIFDMGLIFGIGTFKDKIINLEKKGSTDIASLFASIEKVSQKNLEKLLEDYEALAEN